jgi:VanZ family protein
MTLRRKWLAWLPALLWAGLIFFLSAQSKLPEIGPQFVDIDKVHHLIAYAALGALVMFALRRAHNLSLPKAFLLAILVVSAYGVTDEFHQRFVPNRTCDVWDWTADTLGAGIAATVFYTYESRRSSKTNR